MKTSKLGAAFALVALLVTFGAVTRANAAVNLTSVDPSLIPLGLFFVSAVVVYLCNRPRKVVVYARARRNGDSRRSR